MLNKIKNRKQEGFTIIEVLIVLAIAGLIMLIVFLAVPALQRNSRNTSLKNDASAIGGAVAEFVTNNNGVMPATVTKTDAVVTISKTGTGVVAAEGRVNGSTDVSTTTSALSNIGAGQVRVRFGAKCDASTSTRATAIYYAIEKGTGTPAVGCLDF